MSGVVEVGSNYVGGVGGVGGCGCGVEWTWEMVSWGGEMRFCR